MNWEIATALGIGGATFIYSQIKHSVKPFMSPLNLRILIADAFLTVLFPLAIAFTGSKILSNETILGLTVSVCVLRFHRNIGSILIVFSIVMAGIRVHDDSALQKPIAIGLILGALIPPIFKKFLDILHISLKKSA